MALYIVSTPIGNLEDITLRALKVLFSVGVILAEDTRHTGNLMEVYRRKPEVIGLLQSLEEHPTMDPGVRRDDGYRPRWISFHDFNEEQRIEEVIGMLREGVDMALVSDAGTPLVSDPGFKLVRRCLKEKINVVSIPGASAWVTALTSSGMPTDRVFFLGYLPPRQVRRKKELYQLKEAFNLLRKSPTLVFYEGPHRLVTVLKDILEVCGNVDVCLACELTKLHEKVETRPVSLWVAELGKQKKIKGEYVGLFRFDNKNESENVA